MKFTNIIIISFFILKNMSCMKVNLNNVYTIKNNKDSSKYLIGSSFVRRKNKSFQKKIKHDIEQYQLKHRLLDDQILELEKNHSVNDYELRSLKSKKLQLKDKITNLKHKMNENNDDIIIDEVGNGGYSKVLIGKCLLTNEDKAIKIANVNNFQQLFKEYLVLSRLASFKGFPKVNYFGKQDILDNQQHVVMVMDLLGPSLERTLSFSSIAVLQGKQCAEKDDLESLCYSLSFLLNGSLPWDKIEDEYHCAIKTTTISFSTIIDNVIDMKKSFLLLNNPNHQCYASKLIMDVLNHIKTLSANDKPDYNKLINICNEYIANEEPKTFDWVNDGISWDKDSKLINTNYK